MSGELPVSVYGYWMPRSIFGRFHILCASVRSIYLAFAVLLLIMMGKWNPDIIFVDQISISIPLLKLTGKKVVLECF